MTATILAVIPAYNEAARIAPVLAATQAHLPVLVVDDGSQDETASLAEAEGAAVLRQIPNQGKGAALRAGFHYALKNGYDAVITLDADGQHAPDEIGRFVEQFVETNADLIIGARQFGQMPTVRRISNTLGTWLFSWAMGQHIPDNQSGYRLLSRRMMEAILDSEEQGFEYEVEMITSCIVQGYTLAWVPISTIYAGETSHIQPVKHLTNFLRVVWAARRTIKAAATPRPPAE